MKEPLITMLQIYGTLDQGVDWLDYKINRVESLTFHHLIKKCNGGTRTIDNGAILLRCSHDFLNRLERNYKNYYNDLNKLFFELNRTYAPPTEEYFAEVHQVIDSLDRKIRRGR